MQLAIYETEHFETAYALITLFDLPASSITIFTNLATSEKLHDMCGPHASAYRWIIQKDPETNRQFIRRMSASLKTLNPDIFIFGTVSHNYLLHAWLLRTSRIGLSLLTIHEANSLFKPRLGLGIRKFVSYFGKKLLIRRVDEFIAILETMLPYVKGCVPGHKKVHLLSGAVFENNRAAAIFGEPVKIVIPGTVDQARRDYTQVFNLADAAEASGLRLEITLLGAPRGRYGAEIIRKAHNQKMQYSTINFYSHLVEQTEFEIKIREAHFIFAPILSKTVSPDGIPEIYGETKASGNIFDMIRFAKPAFVPHHLIMPSNLESGCVRYHSVGQIVAHLKETKQEPNHYETLHRNALEGSLNYTVEKIRRSNPELFN